MAVFHHDYARAFTLHSDDDGATWSKPAEITDVFHAFKPDYPWVVCANGCGHGLQLRNGRMIVPVWLSNGGKGEFGPKHRGHRPSDVALIYSDDRGGSWRRGDFVARNDLVVAGVKAVYPSETTAVERSDGSVLFNMRSESARQRRLVAVSTGFPVGAATAGTRPCWIPSAWPACCAMNGLWQASPAVLSRSAGFLVSIT